MTPSRGIMIAVLMFGLTGCSTIGESRFNPFNWFGSNQEESLAPLEDSRTNERRPLVREITALVVEQTPGGAIVRVTGLPPEQGWFAPELVSLNIDGEPIDGVLSYSFRAVPPKGPTRVSTRQSRELTAAVFVPELILQRVRVIQVTGALNSRAARR